MRNIQIVATSLMTLLAFMLPLIAWS
jgi:hypothetical protein